MELLKAIMTRDGCSKKEAMEELKQIQEDVNDAIENGEDPEEVLNEYGWEPDYIFDVLPM